MQEQGGKGDGILPGGRGRSTIFVDTSTVCHSFFLPPHILLFSILSISPSFLLFHIPPNPNRKKGHQRIAKSSKTGEAIKTKETRTDVLADLPKHSR